MINDVSPTTSGYFVTKAHAIIGRLATPMSYAGVPDRKPSGPRGLPGPATSWRGRRCCRGAAAYGAANHRAGNCVQVTDGYGRLVMQCY
jgi:hypothetical protein